jgi:hypothetical protein
MLLRVGPHRRGVSRVVPVTLVSVLIKARENASATTPWHIGVHLSATCSRVMSVLMALDPLIQIASSVTRQGVWSASG